MYRTPWSKQTSSLPSDRIPPANRSSPVPRSRAGGKQKDTAPPKSKEVRKLEGLRDGLNNFKGKDPEGGCFCQARVHLLSEYTPICRSCGLILCSLNAPCYLCPHCNTAVLSPEARSTLIARIENEISDTLLREEQQRQRAVEEARQAEGAFPMLSSSSNRPSDSLPGALQNHPVNQSHKVLSLNTKTKKVKVSSYTAPPPSSVSLSKGSDTNLPLDEVQRIPPPADEVMYITRQAKTDRPWARLDDESAIYVPRGQANNSSNRSADRKRDQRNAAGSAKENMKGSK